jgi:hypothetical protein
VTLVLLNTGFNRMASLPSVNQTTFAWHTIYTWSLESQLIHHMPKENGNRPCRGSSQTSCCAWTAATDTAEVHADKDKEGDSDRFLQGCGDSLE